MKKQIFILKKIILIILILAFCKTSKANVSLFKIPYISPLASEIWNFPVFSYFPENIVQGSGSIMLGLTSLKILLFAVPFIDKIIGIASGNVNKNLLLAYKQWKEGRGSSIVQAWTSNNKAHYGV